VRTSGAHLEEPSQLHRKAGSSRRCRAFRGLRLASPALLARPSFGCSLRLAPAAASSGLGSRPSKSPACAFRSSVRPCPLGQPLTPRSLPLPAQPIGAHALRACAQGPAFRGHPSGSSLRLSDCPSVRFRFPVSQRLAPPAHSFRLALRRDCRLPGCLPPLALPSDFYLRLSPPALLRAHPSDSTSGLCRLSLLRQVPSDQTLSSRFDLNLPVFPSNLSVRPTEWSSVAKDSRSGPPVHASAKRVIPVHRAGVIQEGSAKLNRLSMAPRRRNCAAAPGSVQSGELCSSV